VCVCVVYVLWFLCVLTKNCVRVDRCCPYLCHCMQQQQQKQVALISTNYHSNSDERRALLDKQQVFLPTSYHDPEQPPNTGRNYDNSDSNLKNLTTRINSNNSFHNMKIALTLFFIVAVLGFAIGSTFAKKEDPYATFLWGSATASYQVEGAYNEDGRGLTVWDSFSHTPGKTVNGETGDVADDQYHRFQADIQLIKAMGLNSYRFSIAWSRIFPEGKGNTVNQAGIDHYNALIDGLVAQKITPLVTLFHWDTPLALEQEYDGWLSPEIEDAFVEYANVCFKMFGDRVKHWITLNEPLTVALQGYNNGVNAPGRCSDRTRCTEGDSSTEPYIAAHNMLNAHAAVVELYRKAYQTQQGGVIGITLNADFAYPLHADSAEDQAAAYRYGKISFVYACSG
jgi:hypothetical protein